ncbi:hypothetical protein ACFYVK_35140 [Streptomyces chartreusis]|uniref:hypothetical protein n=1 Tax=Streptomyces chartreusis TaxID=1969 RepID=UPI0036D168C1
MTSTDLLPPPSPALTVHQAAAALRRTAECAVAAMARNDYWAGGWQRGVTNAISGYEGDLAALFSPEMAVEVADWLDEVASAAARRGEPLPPLALTIASALAAHPAP